MDGACDQRDASLMSPGARAWSIDLLFGVLLGGIAGAILAVNVVIFSGIDGGYEATIPEVFRENALLGALVVVILVAGPVAGVVLARRRRSRLGRTRGG